MTLTLLLAQFWGILFTIVGVSFLIRQRDIQALLKLLQDEGMMVLTGYLALMMGIGHILIYNNWTTHWPILLTLIGWMVFFKGLIRLLAPKFTQNLIKFYHKPGNIVFPLIVMIVIGLFLIKKGFGF